MFTCLQEWEAALRSGTLKQDALAVKAARKAALEAAKQAAQSQKGPGAAAQVCVHYFQTIRSVYC